MRIVLRDKLVLLAVLAAVAVPHLSAREMSIAQLQQLMSKAKVENRPDSYLVRKLARAKLTARLDAPVLRELIAESPGPRTTQALGFLADTAVFLDPPAEEVSPMPGPDIPGQAAIIQQTIHYVANTLPTLPNVIATRVTQQLVDSPQGLDPSQTELLGGLYLANTFLTPVAYSNGKETQEPFKPVAKTVADKDSGGLKKPVPDTKDAKGTKDGKDQPELGLTSQGEFGTILACILLDAAKGRITWARWEQIGEKRVAVFRFAVDRAVSHFSVNSWSNAQQEVVDVHRVLSLHGGAEGNTGPMAQTATTSEAHKVSRIAAYHGQLAIDPDTGAVMRIAVQAESPPREAAGRADMMVEYGPVKIGEKIYTLPTHSVGILTSEEENQLIPTIGFRTITVTKVNDVDFMEYHYFGTTSTLIMAPATVADQGGQTGAPGSPNPSGQLSQSDQSSQSGQSAGQAAVSGRSDSANQAGQANLPAQPSASNRPVQALPIQAVPVQAVPVQAAPVQAVPVQASPAQAIPAQAKNVESAKSPS